MIDPYERHILTLSAALIAERVVSAVRQPPARAFFRHFREAMSRASVSVGGVSICFDSHREQPESRLRDGRIEVSRLTQQRDVLRCGNERANRGE